ncbi:DMT family transporter [Dictyobacter formicarum]|uniref:Multidrug DMT transporter permease n=1 Tax=Dictyobacter formicarum TaxID=2778368 RepID=A0ABQ3VIL2_9CHLR|nr:DMT family transporter [Dictyobacter formicarum]GHO85663.1 multidrug DMT transporter permease [Dictyobacter formicarum]
MHRKSGAALLVLSAIWGGSFLLIRVAASVLGPIVLMEIRVLLAGLVLLGLSRLSHTRLDLRERWRHYLVIGIVNSAIPFTLFALAELHLTAGLAAILNATGPLFGAGIAAVWTKETLTTKKGIGLLLGLLGVVVLVGWSTIPFSITLVLSLVAALAAAACYGFASSYIKVYAGGASPLAVATCSQLGASLFLLPLTAVSPPLHVPTFPILLAVAALALVCTAVAYQFYFWLIAHAGPTNALMVNFLVPIFGVLWGLIFLGEGVSWGTGLGCGLILGGAGLVTGLRFGKPSEQPQNKHASGQIHRSRAEQLESLDGKTEQQKDSVSLLKKKG